MAGSRGRIDKIGDEAGELLAAEGAAQRAEEFGDLLMVMVNLGRRLGIDAEGALRGANRKFRARFEAVLALAEARGLELEGLDLDQLDRLWREVKAAGAVKGAMTGPEAGALGEAGT